MNIRQAIFVSVASAGVVASSWFAGPTAATPTTAVPAHMRTGAAQAGTATATAGTMAAASGPRTTAAAGGGGSVLLSPVSRAALRGGSTLQLVSGPGYSAAAYPTTM